MRRLTLFISVALALLAFAIPATAGATRSHHKRTHHARMVDRNHNGMADRWERKFRVHKATADPDRDGVQNIGEFHNGTNPRDADTDNDGVKDGQEKAGQVVSFTAGILTVHLFNGDDVKGTVDADTEIECDDAATTPTTTAPAARAADDGGGDNGDGDHERGDHQGPGDDGQGDDDQGDDDGHDQGQAGCDATKLTSGAVVQEAELKATAAGLVFEKIELVS
jgi:hypothetical protein